MQLLAVQKSVDEENFDKMKVAYDACLNEEKLKSVGAEPLLKALEEVKQTYPVSTTAAPDTHALKDAILLLAKFGVSALVSSGVGADDTDPDTVVVSVSSPWNFGLPSKERYEDDELVEKYRSVAVEVLSALYPDHDKDLFGKIVDLEKRLAAASPSSEERDDVTRYYNPMLVGEAAAIAPEIGLEALLYGLAPKNSRIERVIVMAPNYLKELSITLAATDMEVLQGYFLWKTVQAYTPYVDAVAVKPYKRFLNVLAGKVRFCYGHSTPSANRRRILSPPQSAGEFALVTSTMG
jgi:endothelin-converting enzyme